MSNTITQLNAIAPEGVDLIYDVLPIVSVAEIAPNGSMGVTRKITAENLAKAISVIINSSETIMDIVEAHMVAGTGIAIAYDNLNNIITISNTYSPLVGSLKVENPLSTVLQVVQDDDNINSQLYLATDKTQIKGTLQITTDNLELLDIETSSGNRFNINRDIQKINLDFASNPTGSTSIVGAIRTYQNGTNLSEIVKFREDGQVTITNTLVLSNIPTSSIGLPSGTVWSDLGTLKIIP